eukprot:6423-Eustigmatos_ZCMA.PRE.1
MTAKTTGADTVKLWGRLTRSKLVVIGRAKILPSWKDEILTCDKRDCCGVVDCVHPSFLHYTPRPFVEEASDNEPPLLTQRQRACFTLTTRPAP